MKRTILTITAAFSAALAYAAVTLTNEENRGWQAIRGTSNVGTPHATEAACWDAVRADAEARKASANYRCVNTKAARAEWAADAPPPPVNDPHNGGVQSGNMPRYNPATIPAPAVGFDQLRITATSEVAQPSDIGAFRTVCNRSHFNRDDSLVFPGQVGRAHLHMYFGNTASNANSTPESIRTTGNSTCRGGIANRSTYWIPAIIDTRDGAVMDMEYADVYYKTGYAGVRPADVKPIPPGLRMIAGDMMNKVDRPSWEIRHRFQCGGNSGGAIPANCTSGKLEVELFFPQCWDGRNLTTPDHKSHMAYPDNGCPASHPVALPEITYVVHIPIPAGRNTNTWRLSSDDYTAGPGGYSMHGDWINGWEPSFPPVWTSRIINERRDGGSHLIGDGRAMY